MENLYAFVLNSEIKYTKHGKEYLSMEIRCEYGNVRCNIWQVGKKKPVRGQYILILDYEDHRQQYNSITCNDFKYVQKSEVPIEITSPSANFDSIEEAWFNLTSEEHFENLRYRDFVNECLIEFGDSKEIKKMPAATRIHHNYQGGLIIHTSEVLNICKAIANCQNEYDFLNKDVLYAGAILHDMGKNITYYNDEIGEPNKSSEEQTIGHFFYGMHCVQKVADKKGYNDLEINEILHLIASHHGSINYGSIKAPMSVEAVILSSADVISARNGVLYNYLKTHNENNIPENFNCYSINLFYTSGMKKFYEKIKYNNILECEEPENTE